MLILRISNYGLLRYNFSNEIVLRKQLKENPKYGQQIVKLLINKHLKQLVN